MPFSAQLPNQQWVSDMNQVPNFVRTGTQTLRETCSHVGECEDYCLHVGTVISKEVLEHADFSVIHYQSLFHQWSIHRTQLTSPSDVKSFQPVIKLQHLETQLGLHLQFAAAKRNYLGQNLFRCDSAFWNETDWLLPKLTKNQIYALHKWLTTC
jgi:hypothetical protein